MKPNYQELYQQAAAENVKLRQELAMSDADWELGKKSPRDLAIKWLCRAVMISSYDWCNNEMLIAAIDRLIALDDAANAENKGCCRNYNCNNRENCVAN